MSVNMTYIDLLPRDLNMELYCYFTYEELYTMGRDDKQVQELVYTEAFLNRKGLNFEEWHDEILNMVYEMLTSELLIIKRSNYHLPAKSIKLINRRNEVERTIQAPNIESALYDYLQYHLELSNTIPGMPYFIQALLIVRNFKISLIIEYVKKAATSDCQSYYLKL